MCFLHLYWQYQRTKSKYALECLTSTVTATLTWRNLRIWWRFVNSLFFCPQILKCVTGRYLENITQRLQWLVDNEHNENEHIVVWYFRLYHIERMVGQIFRTKLQIYCAKNILKTNIFKILLCFFLMEIFFFVWKLKMCKTTGCP